MGLSLLLAGCTDIGPCLHADCRAVDSIYANVRLCGFPQGQLDRSQETSRGLVRAGQQIPLRLEGKLDLVTSIRWRVSPQQNAPNPPTVTLDPTSGTAAVMTGVAVGGTHPADYVFVAAELEFKDGTDGVATVSYCRGDDRIPANHIVVVP